MDRTARVTALALTGASSLLVVLIAGALAVAAAPLLRSSSVLGVLASTRWQPQAGSFGMLSFLAGTACVTALAMVMAVPLSLLVAVYLSEYAPRRVVSFVQPLVDILAGIPSVVFGVWGVLVVVPAVARLARSVGAFSSGYSWLAGSIVLAIMICPFTIDLAHEVLAAVPAGVREAALALGATRWQTVKHVVLREAARGLVAATVLGLSRALGETIAVLMVVGNTAAIPRSLFDPIYPLPALIANNYGEMMSIPLYDSALLLAALVLLLLVLASVLLARAMLAGVRGRLS